MKLSSTSPPLCTLTKQPSTPGVPKALVGCLVCVLVPCWCRPCEQELVCLTEQPSGHQIDNHGADWCE